MVLVISNMTLGGTRTQSTAQVFLDVNIFLNPGFEDKITIS
jgi:hypothetical protein